MSETQKPTFKPSLISTLVVIIVVLVSLFLAHWQSGRIDEKKALQTRYESMLKAPALDLNTLNNQAFLALAEQEWQKVRVSGEFLEEYQLLLDSQVYQGKPGYHVIVPLHITGSDYHILVNRGWIAAGDNRNRLPTLPALTEHQPIQGNLAKPKTLMPGFEAQNLAEKVQLFINLPALSDRIGAPLAPMLIQLDERALGPLPREWPKYQAKIEMHEFYVLHWLIVALLSILIYVYFGFKTKKSF